MTLGLLVIAGVVLIIATVYAGALMVAGGIGIYCFVVRRFLGL